MNSFVKLKQKQTNEEGKKKEKVFLFVKLEEHVLEQDKLKLIEFAIEN